MCLNSNNSTSSINISGQDYLHLALELYEKFNGYLIEFTDSIHSDSVEIEFWKKYFEIQLAKFSINSASAIKLIKEGTSLKSSILNQTDITDISSIFNIARSLIENYAMIYYLNFEPNDKEGLFRYLLYTGVGLQNRQQYKTGSSIDIKNKQQEEKLKLEDIIYKIKENNYFKSLSSKDQSFYLKNEKLNLPNISRLIQNSNLNPDIFFSQWKLFSNHAHSELIGMIQFQLYATNKESTCNTMRTTINTLMILLCKLIMLLVNRYPSISTKFKKIPHVEQMIILKHNDIGDKNHNNLDY